MVLPSDIHVTTSKENVLKVVKLRKLNFESNRLAREKILFSIDILPKCLPATKANSKNEKNVILKRVEEIMNKEGGA